jgi:hypothetical protein
MSPIIEIISRQSNGSSVTDNWTPILPDFYRDALMHLSRGDTFFAADLETLGCEDMPRTEGLVMGKSIGIHGSSDPISVRMVVTIEVNFP